MSKEFKPQAYNYIRRGWYEQLNALCDSVMTKKGKDPLTAYWKAFAMGMNGNISDCLRGLESFQSRKDLQFPVTLALMYFHKKASPVDREAVAQLKSELSIAEDVAKEAGLVLAARFCLFTQNIKEAYRISQKVLASKQNSGASTAFEMEATTIVQWCTLAEIDMLGGVMDQSSKQQLQGINDAYSNNRNNEQFEPDAFMVWAKSRHMLGRTLEVYNIINQAIATYPWFLPALADKALLLASDGEWEQALDTAQRLLDVEFDNLDALKVIAVHAFTQESHAHDAVQKLEDLDNAVKAKEPGSIDTAVELAALFTAICARQPRALQICVRLLERAAKQSADSVSDAKCAVLYCQLGNTLVLQGAMQYERAMKAFREATRRDPNSATALQGMILCQCYEGSIEDAESQIELLTVMHTPEDLGYEFAYLQSLLLRGRKDKKKDHLRALTTCRDMFLQSREGGSSKNAELGAAAPGIKTYLNSFQSLLAGSPDFTLLLANDFFCHMEATTSIAASLPSTNALLQSGNALKGQLLQQNAAAAGAAPGAAGMGMTLVADPSMGGGDTFGPGSPTKGGAPGGVGAGGESLTAGVEITRAVQSGLDLLQMVLRQCPGLTCAYVELARCYAGLGMFDEAARNLQQCISLQPNNSPVLVALASVEAGKFNTTGADRVLEQALACDFSIRAAPRFRLVKAIIRAQQSRLDEAITEIEQIMSLPELNFTLPSKKPEGESKTASYSTNAGLENMHAHSDVLSGAPTVSVYSDSLRLTDDDRVGAFVCYASLLGKSRRMKEANKVLSHAKVVFAGSAQEVQVLVAASQLFVEKGDFDAAIRMLDKISEDSPTFARAQLIKADIVLNNNHDKEGFTKCYQMLADKEPSAKNYALLGEAYLRILNPEAAIDALEQAYKLDPKNGRLRGRIGRALVATHEYHRAVEFYESAIRELNKALNAAPQSLSLGSSGGKGDKKAGAATSTGNTGAGNDLVILSHDLSKLYIKLGRAEASIRVLKNVLHDPPTDILSMRQDVTTLLLLAQVQRSALPEDAAGSLQRALATQKDLIHKLRSSTSAVTSSDVMEREKFILSDISEQLGDHYAGDREAQTAEQSFQEAIQQNPHNTKAMLGLARILYARGDSDQCQAQCVKILTAVPTAEEAAILLSEVVFHSEQPEGAVKPLQDLLTLVPNNYLALEKAIALLRRAGQLELAQPLLASAETADRRCQSHAGFHYCQGQYARYTNDIGKAISEFNLARKDEVWGAAALTHMIELYLNPDQEGAWEEKEAGPLDDATRANIAAAEELLKELRPRAKDPKRVRVLESYCQLATRNKLSVERAMQSFSEMLDQDQDYLPAVLGMATGFMIEKNQHKARNLLKRVGKMEVSRHDGEDFEKANLLLAKFYIDKSKSDLAQDLCRKTLLENKSCSQAWEILGLIFEKDSKYDLAADAYGKAWKLEFEASASVGFKLAFSHLKCKQFVEAIDVCETVLGMYPDYPRMSEEILKRAQESIRTAQ